MKAKTTEIDMLACASLFGQGHNQLKIAGTLGLSQPTISRLLRDARKQGYLQEEVRFVRERVNDHQVEQVRMRTSHGPLEKRLQLIKRNNSGLEGLTLRVFHHGSRGESDEEWERRLRDFSSQAAPYFKDVISRASLCGIAWGSTLGGMIASLQKLLPSPVRANTPIHVVPLCGELLGTMPTPFSSSNLAATLEQVLNGSNKGTLSLGMVPAFIPSGFSKEEWKGVWKLIRLVKAYDEIFGSPNRKPRQQPLVKRLDTILTGVGSSERLLGFGKGSLLEASGVNSKTLGKGVLGDIGGVCIPRAKVSDAAKKVLSIVAERWTGIQLEDLAACARRAASKDPKTDALGVVVIALGRNKANCIFEAVKRGLVNALFIDDDLEETLDALAAEESP